MSERESERNFATVNKHGEKLWSFGAVIGTDGSFRRPDQRIPMLNHGVPSEYEVTHIWNGVADDELALVVEYRHAHLDFRVAYRPANLTDNQITRAKHLENEARKRIAHLIDWTDSESWKYDPTSGAGWRLNPPAPHSEEELLELLGNANLFLSRHYGTEEDCPRIKIVKNSYTTYLYVSDNRGVEILSPRELDELSVERTLQLKCDYACHMEVLKRRKEMCQFEYFIKYERLRDEVDAHGWKLTYSDYDGYCLVDSDNVNFFGLNGDDYNRFIHDFLNHEEELESPNEDNLESSNKND